MNYLERNRNVVMMVRGNQFSSDDDDEFQTFHVLLDCVSARKDTKSQIPWVSKIEMDKDDDNHMLFAHVYDPEYQNFNFRTEGMFQAARSASRYMRRSCGMVHTDIVDNIKKLMGPECAEHIDKLKDNLYYLNKI